MERIGLTGWLDPEGEFHPCNYGEHNKFAEKIIDSYGAYSRLRDELLYIPMGAAFNEKESYVFINIDSEKAEPLITQKQKEWFDKNFSRLAKGQQEMVNDWLYEDEL